MWQQYRQDLEGQGDARQRSHPVELVVDTSSLDIRQIRFDEDHNLYVSYGGLSPKIEKRAPPYTTRHR